MNWNQTPPTVPGLYWVHGEGMPSYGEVLLAEVRPGDRKKDPLLAVMVDPLSRNEVVMASLPPTEGYDFFGHKWFGPIDRPAPPA